MLELNASSRAPRHMVRVVSVTPLPAKVRLPALPSKRAHSALGVIAPLIVIVFGKPLMVRAPFIEMNGPATLAGHRVAGVNKQSLLNDNVDT